MVHTVYVESGIADHPRAHRILERFPAATVVEIDRYGEVFNASRQSFRLQKASPALILARKHRGRVLEAPPGYGIGGARNYYFSHMLNCVYDCRYCFLQGMFRGASWVVFVNFEDFGEEIRDLASRGDEPAWFFSGYDCDSLAFDAVTGFAGFALDLFADLPTAALELRTKSVRIEPLLEREPLANCVVAFSFTPPEVSAALENGVPSHEARIAALRRLAGSGWKVGLRFDPLIWGEGWRESYRRLFDDALDGLDASALHSVSLGAFRLPRGYHRRLERLYPEEPLFASPFEAREGLVSYRSDLEEELTGFCAGEILARVPRERFFPCGQRGEARL